MSDCTSANYYTNYCANKLPCGICRLTMSFCPLGNNEPSITWCNTTSTATTQATQEEQT